MNVGDLQLLGDAGRQQPAGVFNVEDVGRLRHAALDLERELGAVLRIANEAQRRHVDGINARQWSRGLSEEQMMARRSRLRHLPVYQRRTWWVLVPADMPDDCDGIIYSATTELVEALFSAADHVGAPVRRCGILVYSAYVAPAHRGRQLSRRITVLGLYRLLFAPDAPFAGEQVVAIAGMSEVGEHFWEQPSHYEPVADSAWAASSAMVAALAEERARDPEIMRKKRLLTVADALAFDQRHLERSARAAIAAADPRRHRIALLPDVAVLEQELLDMQVMAELCGKARPLEHVGVVLGNIDRGGPFGLWTWLPEQDVLACVLLAVTTRAELLDVLLTALDVARRHGIATVTARSIPAALLEPSDPVFACEDRHPMVHVLVGDDRDVAFCDVQDWL